MELFTPLRRNSASSLGMALVMSSTTPLVLLDESLLIKAASGSFCRCFALDPDKVVGREIFTLGLGEWDIPQLRSLLKSTAAGRAPIDAYEIDLNREAHPTCRLVLSAHMLNLPEADGIYIVLAVSDVTEARKAERVKDEMVREKQLLLLELQHRVANSLQIIASVLMQSVRRVQSEETRSHLRDAHHRVMSIATLQRQLASTHSTDVALGAYFTELCDSIGASMIGDPSQIELIVTSDATVTSGDASVSLGLIVTELVINALKHAYPAIDAKGTIQVDYHSTGSGWTLSVADDGIGMPKAPSQAKPGLGTGIVNALAKQLGAQVVITDAAPGTKVAIINA